MAGKTARVDLGSLILPRAISTPQATIETAVELEFSSLKTTTQSFQERLIIMSEKESKGISLRTKRKGRPAISAPKQISEPIAQTAGPRSNGKSSFESAPPQRPQASGKVCATSANLYFPGILGRGAITNQFPDLRPRKTTVFYSI